MKKKKEHEEKLLIMCILLVILLIVVIVVLSLAISALEALIISHCHTLSFKSVLGTTIITNIIMTIFSIILVISFRIIMSSEKNLFKKLVGGITDFFSDANYGLLKLALLFFTTHLGGIIVLLVKYEIIPRSLKIISTLLNTIDTYM